MSKLAPFAEAIAAWKAAGRSDQWISDRLLLDHGVEVSVRAIAKHRLKRGLVVGMGRRPPKLDAPARARLRRDRDGGVTWDDLCARFGISRPTMAKYLREEAHG